MSVGPWGYVEELGDAGSFRDSLHDPWLTCTGVRLISLAEELFVDAEMNRPWTSRRPRSDALERRRSIAYNLIASLVALSLGRGTGSSIMVSAKNEPITRYDRRDFPRQAVTEVIHNLAQAGWLNHRLGSRHGRRSTIRPTSKLRDRLGRSGVTLSDVGRLNGGETIILKARAQSRWSPKPLIDYPDTAETRELRAQLGTINAFLNSAGVTVDGASIPPFHLTRHFMLDSPDEPPRFEQHGRVYGGPWINMHREERYRLAIAGEELADLDFTAMFTQLAYLTAGAALPEGDPYDGVPGLEVSLLQDPLARAKRRQALKQVLNALYSRRGRMSRLPHEIKAVLGPEWTGATLEAAFARRHAPIRHLFGIGIGLRLAFIESNVLLSTLLDLMADGVPALPVHDGIMVRRSQRAAAFASMRRASHSVVGVELPVRAKELLKPRR